LLEKIRRYKIYFPTEKRPLKTNGYTVAKKGLFRAKANRASKARSYPPKNLLRSFFCGSRAACWGIPKPPAKNPCGFFTPVKPSLRSVCSASRGKERPPQKRIYGKSIKK